MNKIYGLNIDMLRLCYEIKEPNNINIIVCTRTISCTSPVIRCYHNIFLRYQLADDMSIIGVHIGMYPTMRKYD